MPAEGPRRASQAFAVGLCLPIQPPTLLNSPSNASMAPLTALLRTLGRVEDWRVDYRVRWLFRRFRFGPQSGSLITFPVPALRTGRAVFPHLGSPVGSCVSHTGPRSHPWTTPMGLAPVPHSIHFRSRVAARPVDALTTPSSSDDPFTFACDASGVSGPFCRGFRLSPLPGPFPLRSPLLT